MRRGRATGGGRWRWLLAPFTPRGLSGFALLGFFGLSVIATGLGFADLRAANSDAGRLGPAELALTIALTLFVVSAMVVALHNVVSETHRWWVRLLSFVFYLLFAVWTVGFGYGFFWKELAGQEFTERQFEGAISGLSQSISRTSAALETAERSTAGAASLAAERAKTEAREGRTCANHPTSTPGEGPLMRSRFAFAERARNLAGNVDDDWIAPIAAQRNGLQLRLDALVRHRPPSSTAFVNNDERATLDKLANASALPVAERRTLFVGVNDEARAFAASANTLRGLHAAAIADRLTQLAAEVGPDPQRPGSPDPARANDPGYCWDVLLNERLTSAATQLRGIEDVATPQFEFLEGPKATRAAFFALISWLGQLFGLKLDLAQSIPFGEKEFLALFASLAVDLGIVFLTIVRDTPTRRPRAPAAAAGKGEPRPPRLASILGVPPGS